MISFTRTFHAGTLSTIPRVIQSKCCLYNNEGEDNSLNVLSDKNYPSSSQKFKHFLVPLLFFFFFFCFFFSFFLIWRIDKLYSVSFIFTTPSKGFKNVKYSVEIILNTFLSFNLEIFHLNVL